MKTTLMPKLVNGQTGDPALYVDLLHEKRALLFDCGQIHDLSAAEILRISDVFISHAHIDHFIGFDQLLRLHLGRGRRLRVFGPKGITDCVRGKLAGYTWNLVKYQRLVFEVHEAFESGVQVTEFVCRHQFRSARSEELPRGETLFADDLISVKTAVLDHRIPCLAFSLAERDFYNVDPVKLKECGLVPGPWLNKLKAWVRASRPAGQTLQIDNKEVCPAELADALLIHKPGRQIGYVTDAQGSAQNQQRIVELVKKHDLLFCEGAFLQEDQMSRGRNLSSDRLAGG